jgi:hypothetical protein
MSQAVVPFPDAPSDSIGEAIDRELATLTRERDALCEQLAPLSARIGRLEKAKEALDATKMPVSRAGVGKKTDLVLSILAEAGRALRSSEVRDIAVARGLKEKSPNEVFSMLYYLAAPRPGGSPLRRVSYGTYEAVV